MPLPNIAGAAFGQINFIRHQPARRRPTASTRRSTTRSSSKDQISVPRELHAAGGVRSRAVRRSTAARPTAASPAPAPTPASAPRSPGRASSATTTVMDVRGGVNYYHNVTRDAGATASRPARTSGSPARTSTSSPAACRQINIGGYWRSAARVLGQPAVGPLREDLELRGSVTKLLNKHTVKFGGEFRKNNDLLLQTQDAGGPRGTVQLQRRRGPANPADAGVDDEHRATRSPRSCSTGPARSSATSRSSTSPGTRHWACSSFIQDKWQVRSNVTVDLGLRWEFYTPLQGIEGKGIAGQLRSGDHTIQVAGLRRHLTNALNVKNYFKNFAPRTGIRGASTTRRSSAPATARARFRSRTTATRSTSR